MFLGNTRQSVWGERGLMSATTYIWYLHENIYVEKEQGKVSVMVKLGEGYTRIPYIIATCLLNLYQNKKL